MMATRRTMITTTMHLLPSRSANLGVIELNNPSALNSLDLDMVRSINAVLPIWQSDPTIRATLFVGAHGKRPTFCAGGDVKSVYMSGMGLGGDSRVEVAAKQGQHGYGERGLLTADFFREEYEMNNRIATQDHDNVPQISIWDGFVMGGGVGVSVHGKYRVATEKTVFAMPETGIGLFPDVGGMYFLPRLKGGMGQYIALTGHRLKADDLLFAGIATHFIPSDKLEALRPALVEATTKTEDARGDCVAGTLMSFHESVKKDESFLSRNRDDIDRVFGDKDATLENIVVLLENMAASGSDFGEKTLSALLKQSPTSLKVTHEGLRRGAELPSVADVLQMEYRMAQGFMRNKDFYEGVRAVLVDKDHNPKWDPDTLDGVTDGMVKSYFDGLGENDLALEAVKRTSKM